MYIHQNPSYVLDIFSHKEFTRSAPTRRRSKAATLWHSAAVVWVGDQAWRFRRRQFRRLACFVSVRCHHHHQPTQVSKAFLTNQPRVQAGLDGSGGQRYLRVHVSFAHMGGDAAWSQDGVNGKWKRARGRGRALRFSAHVRAMSDCLIKVHSCRSQELDACRADTVFSMPNKTMCALRGLFVCAYTSCAFNADQHRKGYPKSFPVAALYF